MAMDVRVARSSSCLGGGRGGRGYKRARVGPSSRTKRLDSDKPDRFLSLGRGEVDERDAVQRAVEVDCAHDHVVERELVVARFVNVSVVNAHDRGGRDRDERKHVDGHICGHTGGCGVGRMGIAQMKESDRPSRAAVAAVCDAHPPREARMVSGGVQGGSAQAFISVMNLIRCREVGLSPMLATTVFNFKKMAPYVTMLKPITRQIGRMNQPSPAHSLISPPPRMHQLEPYPIAPSR